MLATMRDDIEKKGMPVKKGLFELLVFLRERSIKFTIATSSARKNGYFLQKAGIAEYFGEIVTGDMISRGKPDPDIYLKACELIGMNPGDCIALEDSLMGIQSAHRAGLKPVMIPDLVPPDAETEKRLFARAGSLLEVIDLLRHEND